MTSLADLTKAVNEKVISGVIDRLIHNEGIRQHLRHGWKTECRCNVCLLKRDEIFRQKWRSIRRIKRYIENSL